MEGMRRKRAPSRITPRMFFEESDEARRLFARMIGARPDHVALIPSASYGIATVARNVNIAHGQNIVVMHEQFPSNVYSWKRLAREAHAELRTAAPPPPGPQRGRLWSERILESIDSATAAVALSVIHWADGTPFALEAIGKRARDVGAAFIVDGTQSVGAIPFDAMRLGADALICAGYKWLLGPYSIGALYLGPRFHDGVPLEENWIARRGSEHFGRLVIYEEAYQDGALRYDVGERSNFILLPMMIAGLRQVLAWGPDRIQEYCKALTRDVLREARSWGYSVNAECSPHLFGIRLPKHVSRTALTEELTRHGVSVSVRGDAFRVSPHVYNDEEDIGALRDALAACA